MVILIPCAKHPGCFHTKQSQCVLCEAEDYYGPLTRSGKVNIVAIKFDGRFDVA